VTDLSVLIVTYRCREYARACLKSLLRAGGLDGLTAEVLLLDNASGDGTPEMVRAEFPEVTVADNAENLGFARGNNRLAAMSTGRHLLLLNPDTEVPPGALARCVAYLDEQPPPVAGMTCRVESPDGTLQRDCSRRFVTPWSEVSRAFLLDRIFKGSAFFNPEPIPGWDRADARPVEAILGAFMLVRRSAWESVGGLDERFFLMYEDMDWCKRAGDAGLQLLFWPGERIVHHGGGSWRHEKIATYANSHRSALQYFEKHHPRALPTVRRAAVWGMALKIGLLRLNLLRKPGDEYTVTHLAMARRAMDILTGRETGRVTEATP
jgi:GT2 family glycosyltransferase